MQAQVRIKNVYVIIAHAGYIVLQPSKISNIDTKHRFMAFLDDYALKCNSMGSGILRSKALTQKTLTKKVLVSCIVWILAR